MSHSIRRAIATGLTTIGMLAGLVAPAGATTNGANDPTFDWGVTDGGGDITAVAATYGDGIVGLALKVRNFEPTFAYNWSNGFTFIIWTLATPSGNFDVHYYNDGGLQAVVMNGDSSVKLCDAVASDASEMYFAAFPKECLGSPSVIQVEGYIHYDDIWGGAAPSFDFAPDGGFCCSVTETVTGSTPNPTPNPTTNPDPQPVQQPTPGYWMIGADGGVYNFGTLALGSHYTTAVDIESTPSGGGYWILNDKGEVFTKGDAGHLGNAGLAAGEKAVSLSSTPSGNGYWIFTDRGRVIAKGGAQHKGDMAGKPLASPVLDSVATPSGNGYYMVAGDGGIFTFGDAQFAGSMGGKHLNKPVMSMAPDGDGNGYLLVASDGGIFAFDAKFHGSMGDKALNKPISGIVPGTDGYLMVAEDGGIFAFGNVEFKGSLGANPPPHPIVAVTLHQ
jgi:hypothetical protein